MRILRCLPQHCCGVQLCGLRRKPAEPNALTKAHDGAVCPPSLGMGAADQCVCERPKPSTDLPGFKEVVVTGSAGQAARKKPSYISNDGKRIIRGAVYDIATNPFESDKAKLKTDMQPSFGDPGAPVAVVIFSDFQCSFCKEEANMIRKNVPSAFPTQVRVYFKDFPLEPIHPWAKPAAVVGRCVSVRSRLPSGIITIGSSRIKARSRRKFEGESGGIRTRPKASSRSNSRPASITKQRKRKLTSRRPKEERSA